MQASCLPCPWVEPRTRTGAGPEELWGTRNPTGGAGWGGSSEQTRLGPMAKPGPEVHTVVALLVGHKSHFLNYFPSERQSPEGWPHSLLWPVVTHGSEYFAQVSGEADGFWAHLSLPLCPPRRKSTMGTSLQPLCLEVYSKSLLLKSSKSPRG